MNKEKKIIKIETDIEDLGVSVTVDNKNLTSHFEVDMPKAIERLLVTFGVSKDEFKIIDGR